MSSLKRVTDSILAADVGSIWTRAILIDRVDGKYRFIAFGDAPSTTEPPHFNVLVGVRAAIQEIEASTGRKLLDHKENLISPEGADGNGVDLFIVTSSAAPPLKVAVAGLVERVSVASARRAAYSTYSTVTHSFAVDSPLGRWSNPRGTRGVVEQLTHEWPDAIVLAGGTEGGAEDNLLELAEAIALALQAAPDKTLPTVIFAGNSAVHEQIEQRLASTSNLIISENIRPTLSAERLRLVGKLLDNQFRSRRLTHISGSGALRAWNNNKDLLPTVSAFSRVVQYLALRHEKQVLGIDIGGANTSLVVTFENGTRQTMVRTDLGMADNAQKLLTLLGPERIATWVPGLSSTETLINEYMNLSLHPAQYPMTMDALRLLQGMAREILQLVMQEAIDGWLHPDQPTLTPAFDIILGSGSAIRGAPRPEQALSILLDGIQPTGITHLMRDGFGLAAAIGALADLAPYAAADLLEVQGFESLGVVITPVGIGQAGDKVLEFRLTQGDSVTEGVADYGQSYRFPTQKETTLQLTPTRKFDLGLGAGVGTTITRKGDSVGFVIDTRGRPLILPTELAARRERVEEWLRYVGA